MKFRFIILLLAILASCSEKNEPVEVRVEKWYEKVKPLAEYRKLQPDRPILVFYNANWGLMGLVAIKHMNKERFLDLLTEHRVLPLIADCTDTSGSEYVELNKIKPDGIHLYCFSLSRPGEEIEWFQLNGVSSDKLYELLKTKLSE